MLKKLFIIRHGESDEDVDVNIKGHNADSDIGLTYRGKQQVEHVAQCYTGAISCFQNIRLFVSPSNRAKETADALVAYFPHVSFIKEITPCLRNLDWGNINQVNKSLVERARYKAGVLHFTFPGGDHTLTYVQKLEEFSQNFCSEGKSRNYPECAIILTHGFALRVLAKHLLKMTEAHFRRLANPPNCYVASFTLCSEGISIDYPLPITDKVF